MSRKKKTTTNASEAQNDEIYKNLKEKNSQENLSTVGSSEKMRKRSMLSIPTEGEEEDEFLFIRLRKQIKGHWDKIMERHPNGNLFFRPVNDNKTEESEEVSTSVPSIQSNETPISITSTLAPVEQNFLGAAIKSSLLLPAFSCKRDDEGRKIVPFISSLLQVKPEKET